MQKNPKFTRSYSDDWDEILVEEPTRIESTRLEGAAKPFLAKSDAEAVLDSKAQQISLHNDLPSASAPTATSSAAQIAIPMPEKLMRYPGLLARSAIFRVGRTNEENIEHSEIACYSAGYQVIFEGPRLGMRDKSIWECALRAAKEQGHIGRGMPLSANYIATVIGGGDSGPALARIGQSLQRLSEARIEYQLPGGSCGGGNMLGSACKTASGWRVSFDVGLINLLGEDKQFEINTARRGLLSSDLAKWLHDFMSTHKFGYECGFKLGCLLELSGWRGDAGQFPSRLGEALVELSSRCPELINGFRIVRGQRNSSNWRVLIDKGSEAVCFEVPAKKIRARPNGRPRRGGVSL